MTIFEEFGHLKCMIEGIRQENKELKAQIEKMKCCQNCKYSYVNRDYEPCNLCSNYINWEIAE